MGCQSEKKPVTKLVVIILLKYMGSKRVSFSKNDSILSDAIENVEGFGPYHQVFDKPTRT